MAGVKFTGPLKNKDSASPGSRGFFRNLPIGQEPDLCVYFNDFLEAGSYDANDWVITTTEDGAGDATEALAADEACGALLLTNDNGATDADSLQMTEENWRLTTGKQLWFETRIKINDVDQVNTFVGLGITDTTPLDTSDRVGFQIDDGNASILCKTEKNTTETSTDSAVDAADATYVKLGFHWDGISRVRFYVDRSLVATHTTNVPDDENLCVTFHHGNGEADNQTMHIDYIYVAQER